LNSGLNDILRGVWAKHVSERGYLPGGGRGLVVGGLAERRKKSREHGREVAGPGCEELCRPKSMKPFLVPRPKLQGSTY
jgi:hypothetical protein